MSFSRRDDQVAPLEEARAHVIGGVLRTGDRRDRRPLRDLRRARFGVGDPAREHRRQRAVGDVADAPAGHRPGLRRAVADDRALEHVGSRGERIEAAVVHEPRIDLVGEHPHLRMAREDFGDGVEVGAVEDAAGRILRRVEDQQPRLRRDLRFELGGVEREVARLAQEDRAPARRRWRGSATRRSESREPGRSLRRRRRSR